MLHSRLKEARERKGITQKELGDYLNVTFQTISKWELGKSMPDIFSLAKICKILNLNLEYLLACENNKEMELKEYRLSGNVVFKGKLLEVHDDEVVCPNGNVTHREYINKGMASCIVAKVNGKFVLEKQFRYPYNSILIEFPAGKCDPNEEPRKTAIRELEEETGYRARELVYLGECYPSVAYTNERIKIYYSDNLVVSKKAPDENEFVEVFLASDEEVKKMIISGEIKDAKTIQAYCLYKLKFDRL